MLTRPHQEYRAKPIARAIDTGPYRPLTMLVCHCVIGRKASDAIDANAERREQWPYCDSECLPLWSGATDRRKWLNRRSLARPAGD